MLRNSCRQKCLTKNLIDTFIHTYIHIYIHTYIHTFIHTYILGGPIKIGRLSNMKRYNIKLFHSIGFFVLLTKKLVLMTYMTTPNFMVREQKQLECIDKVCTLLGDRCWSSKTVWKPMWGRSWLIKTYVRFTLFFTFFSWFFGRYN